MSSRIPSSLRPDPTNQPTYVWSRIDPRTNRLIRDKLRKATLEFKQEIDRETNRIRLQNRLNLNKTGVDQQIAGMWAGKIHAHVEMCYDKIYCHHWGLLGHRKTSAFVRACSAILGGYIDTLGSTEAHKARIAHRRQGGVRPSIEGLYESSAGSLRKELEERLDIEARELDLAESLVRAQNHSDPRPRDIVNPPTVTSPLDPYPIPGLGEIVVEGGPLSAEDTETTATAVEMLQKLGFGVEEPEWPSQPFGPVTPSVLRELKRAHRVLTTQGFLVVGDPLNPLGDGKSWVLRFEPTNKLPKDADFADVADRHLQSDGIKVAAKPVQDGRTFLVALWDSGRVPSRHQPPPIAKSGRDTIRSKNPIFYAKSKSYQTIVFRQREYTLTPQAAAIVRVLHEAGGKPIAKADIQFSTSCGKISDSFRRLDGPKVWKKLIEVTKGRKGFYCLRPQAFN